MRATTHVFFFLIRKLDSGRQAYMVSKPFTS